MKSYKNQYYSSAEQFWHFKIPCSFFAPQYGQITRYLVSTSFRGAIGVLPCVITEDGCEYGCGFCAYDVGVVAVRAASVQLYRA